MKGSFGPAMDYQGGRYGNAVPSRFPIAGEHTHALPGKDGEPRSGAEALVVPGMRPHDDDFVAKVALASDHMPLVAEFRL